MRLADEIIEKYGLTLDRRQTGQLSRLSGNKFSLKQKGTSMSGMSAYEKKDLRYGGRSTDIDKLAERTQKFSEKGVSKYQTGKTSLEYEKRILNDFRKRYEEQKNKVLKMQKTLENWRKELLAAGVSRSLLV